MSDATSVGLGQGAWMNYVANWRLEPERSGRIVLGRSGGGGGGGTEEGPTVGGGRGDGLVPRGWAGCVCVSVCVCVCVWGGGGGGGGVATDFWVKTVRGCDNTEMRRPAIISAAHSTNIITTVENGSENKLTGQGTPSARFVDDLKEIFKMPHVSPVLLTRRPITKFTNYRYVDMFNPRRPAVLKNEVSSKGAGKKGQSHAHCHTHQHTWHMHTWNSFH